MSRLEFLIIDPQRDFIDLDGALPVKGAIQDMYRLADLLSRVRRSPALGDVHVTLDTHHRLHVAHPGFWVDEKMQHPSPFTIIGADDVRSGRWRTRWPQMQKRGLAYVEALAAEGRYPLCIWPEHCLIGHEGATIYPVVRDALDLLEAESPTVPLVDYVTKGSNYFTEHYGAVKAEVVDPADPSTSLNVDLIEALKSADRILIAGEALSHCVANTVRDIADSFGEDNVKKMVLLSDCSSPVGSFEALAEGFVRDLTARGMQRMTAKEAESLFL